MENNNLSSTTYDFLDPGVKYRVTELLDALTQKKGKFIKWSDKEEVIDYVLDFYNALVAIPQLTLADLRKGSEKLEYTINSLSDGPHLFINTVGNLVCGKISRRTITKEALFRVLKMVSPTPLPATFLEVYSDSGNLEDWYRILPWEKGNLEKIVKEAREKEQKALYEERKKLLDPLILKYGESAPLKTLLETFSFDELLDQGILKACEDAVEIPPERVAVSVVDKVLKVSSFEVMQKRGNDRIYLLDLSKLVSTVENKR